MVLVQKSHPGGIGNINVLLRVLRSYSSFLRVFCRTLLGFSKSVRFLVFEECAEHLSCSYIAQYF